MSARKDIIATAIAKQDAARTTRILRATGVPTKAIWADLTGESGRGVTWTRIEYRIARAVERELLADAEPARLAA